jgi:hypothetical protein
MNLVKSNHGFGEERPLIPTFPGYVIEELMIGVHHSRMEDRLSTIEEFGLSVRGFFPAGGIVRLP